MNAESRRIDPVVLIGTGLVGASIGIRLTNAGLRVHLRDRVRSHAVVAAGLGAGVLDEPTDELVRLVIVATPPDSLAAVVTKALARYPNAVVTDVGSVKASVLAALGGVDSGRYVGSHPMAGSQFSGPLTAAGDLFEDRTWVITPRPENPVEAVEAVRGLAHICGARVVEMPPDVHDQAVAQVSHLPHLMSILTAAHLRVVPREHLHLAGQGIRDVTRIAGSDPGLWRQILGANTHAVRTELEGVKADLDELLGLLDSPIELEEFLSRGLAGARSLPGKHGQHRREFAQVVVEIPDEPNALGRLFTEIGDLGVNVEDIHITHDDTRQIGFLSIDVAQEHAGRLAADLVERGWRVRNPPQEGPWHP